MNDQPRPGSSQEADESIASYQKLLEHDPTSQVFALVAEHLCAKGLWQEAAATCRRGLVFHPHHLKGKVLLGRALRELGEVDEAEHILTEAHKELSKSAILYQILSGIAGDKGDGVLAEHYRTIHQLLESGPEPAADADAVPEGQEVFFKPEPPQRKLLDVLAHLSARYEREPAAALNPGPILSEADRQQLYEMFNLSTG